MTGFVKRAYKNVIAESATPFKVFYVVNEIDVKHGILLFVPPQHILHYTLSEKSN